VCWYDIGERKLVGPDLILQIVEKAVKIKKYMTDAQDSQKKWADSKRRPLEFVVSDHVFLKISPTRGVISLATVGS